MIGILTLLLLPLQHSSAQDGWMEDAVVLLGAVKEIHPDPFHVHAPERWDEALMRFEQALPELAEHERVLALARILALAGDGHTEPANWRHPSLSGAWYPVIPRRFADGWYVRYAHGDYRGLFGQRIVSVAGVPVDEVARRVRPFVSVDNEMGSLDPIGNMMRMPAVLHAAGVTAGREEWIPVATVDGAGTETVTEVFASGDAWVTGEWLDADYASEAPEPLYMRLDGNYDFRYLEDEKLVYVLFDSVRNDGDETIEEFFGRVFEFVDANDVEKFVLDIRENGGGNNYLNYPILHGLLRSKVNRPGSLFVVIGRDTFSAAMCLAVALERHTYALFVGEPTGATPNHYGDTREVVLPNSGLTMEISELHWQNSDPRDRRPWITPDLPAGLSYADFFAQRDPALEAILAYAHDPGAPVLPPAMQWQRDGQLLEQRWPGLLAD